MSDQLTRWILCSGVLAFATASLPAQTHVTANLDIAPTTYHETCPFTLNFRGAISADGPTTVTYRYKRSDGGTGPKTTLKLPQGGTVPITTAWTLGASYEGWISVEVLGPISSVSPPARFNLTCAAAAASSPFKAPTFQTNPSVSPQVKALYTLGRLRPVAAIKDGTGNQADFVENELLVSTDDPVELNAFLARWGGSVVDTIDFAAAGLYSMPRTSLVVLDPSAADPLQLPAHVRRLDPLSHGDHSVSSAAALKLLAAAAQEAAAHKVLVTVNWLLYSSDFHSRSTVEAPGVDAYRLPYMTSGPLSVQNIGVGEAWRNMALRGRLGNRVTIGILDAGFATPSVNGDYPASTRIFGSPFGTPNPWASSTGGPARWHGTAVANAAMGMADNGKGAAGPAGPIANAVLIQSPNPDLASILRYMTETLPSGLSAGSRILNMSLEVPIPASLFLLGDLVNTFTRGLRNMGILIFASAGNHGQDVDAMDLTWEKTWWMPCENDGVICVGGLGRDFQGRFSGSNFGTRTDQATTVRLFAPWFVFAGANDEAPANVATEFGGTSFSSPFAAGVAALIWAADPALSSFDVEDLLLSNAHTGSLDGTVSRWVDADRSVSAALGDSPVSAPAGPCSTPQNFRVTLTGFTVNHETTDHILELDGAGDEVFLAAAVRMADSTGHITSRADRRSVLMGDINRHREVPSIQAGSKTSLGGLGTGDNFPVNRPWFHNASDPVLPDRLPLLLFEGSIPARNSALLVVPTVWEWDGPDMSISGSWDAPVSSAETPIADFLRRFIAGTTPGPVVPGSRFGLSGIGAPGIGAWPGNRPIGIAQTSRGNSFDPQGIALTCSSGLDATRLNSGFGAGVIPITYTEPFGTLGFNGNYTLFVKVEWRP